MVSLNFAYAQTYKSESGKITFFSDAAIEDIAAENTGATSIFNADNGEIVFSVPITSFDFDKSLMKEHFNEKYMDSEKHPKSTFSGKLTGYTKEDGVHKAKATGKLLIHGVTRDVTMEGTVEFKNGKAFLASTFMVKLEDYKVKIPRLLWQNIAEEVEVKVNFEYKPYAQ